MKDFHDEDNFYALLIIVLIRPILNTDLVTRSIMASDHSLESAHEISVAMVMGPLQLTVTWYTIHHATEQVAHWDIKKKATSSSQT